MFATLVGDEVNSRRRTGSSDLLAEAELDIGNAVRAETALKVIH